MALGEQKYVAAAKEREMVCAALQLRDSTSARLAAPSEARILSEIPASHTSPN